MAAQRRVLTASYLSIIDERTPLILPPEDILPGYGIQVSAIEDEEDGEAQNGTVQNGNGAETDDNQKTSSTSPVTVVLVLIVGTIFLMLATS